MKFINQQIISLLLISVVFLPATLHAQNDSDFFKAERLQKEQKFEEAYRIFSQLHKEDPTAFAFLNKAAECLVSLKRYDKAIEITQQATKKSHYPARAKIQLGEIYHVSGNEEQAFSIWDKIEQQYADNRRILMRLAGTMRDRKEFERAVEIYKSLRNSSSSPSKITSKLASTYLKAGDYRKAISSFLQLVKKKPSRMNYVQQRLIRFRDDHVYDVAIPAISDFLDDLPSSHPSYNRLQQLEVWLLTERNLYRRAVVTAQNAEAQSSGTTYILYNLGSKLAAAKKFELAEQTYKYYIDKNNQDLKYRCLQELSSVYKKWAQYLDDYNLSLSAKRDSLYQQSYQALQKIRTQKSNYRQSDEVLTSLADLSLDILHRPGEAGQYLSALQNLNSNNKAKTEFIQGRLHLYNGQYSRARVAFTNSTKQAQTGELTQESRYYSALTEFYTGSYEFSKLQLNSIKRQSNSYFANDALQLRLWIQDGLKADSTGSMLDPLASAVEDFSQGKTKQANQQLKTIVDSKKPNPLKDDALLLWSSHKSPKNILEIYSKLVNYLESRGAASPLHERLLWERARIADQLVTNKSKTLDKLSQSSKHSNTSIPNSVGELVEIYEYIILKYPHGFYASHVRNRLNKLKNRKS